MAREEIDSLLEEIRAIRKQALAEQNDLSEADFELSTASFRRWKWDTARRVLLQFGNHMREHATHIEGMRAAMERLPTQPQRMLAEAEIVWGMLLAAMVGLSDEDLDAAPPDGGWTIRRILEHVRNSETDYLDALRMARSGGPARLRLFPDPGRPDPVSAGLLGPPLLPPAAGSPHPGRIHVG